jgi:hypothetical protein
MPRVGYAMLESAVVSQHDETLAVGVKAAGRVNIRLWKIVFQRRVRAIARELADDAVRLIE